MAMEKLSDLEAEFMFQLRVTKTLKPVHDYRFSPPRRWRFDFAWPSKKVAVEVEGGSWVAGRHVRGQGFEQDCKKYNAAVLAGWKVLRCTGKMVESGECLASVERVLLSGSVNRS